jgi:hypothetical protein
MIDRLAKIGVAVTGVGAPPIPSTFFNFLRWTALLPGAILGGWVAYLIMRIPFMLFSKEDSLYYNEAISHFVLGFGFIYCGYFIAPSHKRQASFALTVLGLLVLGAALGMTLVSVWLRNTPWLRPIIEAAAMIAGVVFGAVVVLGESMWASSKKSIPEEKLTAEEIKRILDAYGDLLCDRHPSIIYDESHLPTTKDRIKQALVVAIATAQNDEERSGYRSAYLFLSGFQPGVGAKPFQLPPEGFDIKDIDRHADDIKRLAHWGEKMEAESKVLQQELRAIEERLNSRRG